jgi:site-specific DNA-adenine methylase
MNNTVTKPILHWQGSKTRLLKQIMPLIKPHVCYCEPFFGGGANRRTHGKQTFGELIITPA